jgi:glutamate-1-semialdehyde 2,1-aminomutase
MRRFDPRHPMRMAYIVGTFAAHPAVMGAMNAFLCWVGQADVAAQYEEMNRRCSVWVNSTNRRLAAEDLPVRIVNLATVWTVLFTEPSRYNWLLQYYLRAQGATLSWVGTGRCLVSMDFTDDDYDALETMLVNAARTMKRDGWWLTVEECPGRERLMRAGLVREVLGSLVQVPEPLRMFYAAVMKRKEDDHHASHSHKGNQFLHLLSSSVFIYCYVLIFTDVTTAMCLGLAALFVRQIGHAVLEPPCHDKESLLLGFTTRDKTLVVLGYGLIAVVAFLTAGGWSRATWSETLPVLALYWFRWTVVVVLSRVTYLIWEHDFRISMIWFVKLMTDPLTDIVAYFPRRPERA